MAQATESVRAANWGDRTGIVFAVAAAASAAVLLFLPVLMLAFGLFTLVAAIGGEPIGSTFEMTVIFLAIPTIASLILLIVPYRLLRAAATRMGTRQAVVWGAGLLTVGYVAVAIIWAWSLTSGFSHARTGADVWYPIAYGLAALIAAAVVGRRTAVATAIVVAVLAVLLTGFVHGRTPIPSGAEVVHVSVSASGMAQVEPSTVHAGDVYVVLDTPRSRIGFVQDELTGTDLPRTGSFDLDGCTDAQRAEDVGQQGYCGNAFKVNLPVGKYVFIGPNGNGPPSPMSRLEVQP